MIRITHKIVNGKRPDALYAHKFCLDRAKLEVNSDIETNS